MACIRGGDWIANPTTNYPSSQSGLFPQNPVSISECHQGDEEREKFHQVYPPPSFDPKNKTEGHILLGEWDTENEKLGVILGVWKPLHPNPVSINKQ